VIVGSPILKPSDVGRNIPELHPPKNTNANKNKGKLTSVRRKYNKVRRPTVKTNVESLTQGLATWKLVTGNCIPLLNYHIIKLANSGF
jgi:hypothetical protein